MPSGARPPSWVITGCDMTTIYDVAAKAGVSPATVSRVFNGYKVTPAKAEAVRAAARELDFVPNRNARRLRTQRSTIVAMMIPDIENPFYTAMTRAVEDVMRQAGYSTMLCNTDGEVAREAEYLRAAVGESVAGVIIAPASLSSDLRGAVERKMPVVCVDRGSPLFDLDAVVVDNVGGARQATALLFEAGYRRVGCITGPEQVETAEARLRGWELAVMDATGQQPEADLGRHVPYTIDGGERAMAELLALPKPPDAVLAANNKLAMGALRLLLDRDLMPPKVGMASLGGLPLVTMTPRDVLVTHLPARDLGTRAATMLLERIEGYEGPGRRIVLPTEVTDDQAGLEDLNRESPAT